MILVTGGSQGLGRATVLALSSAGLESRFTYFRGEERAREVEQLSGGRSVGMFLDLSDPEGPTRIVEELQQQGHPVRHLVNNAGMGHSALLAMTSDADLSRVLEVNLAGPFRMMRAVIPSMLREGGGSIVNLLSLAMLRGSAGQAAYAASKAGLMAMTRTLAREMGRKNIRVNAVAPGFLATGMTAGLPAANVERMRAHECLPAGVSLDSVAATVLFLISEKAASITGQCIVVDAGASI